jgi:hypothetical protein
MLDVPYELAPKNCNTLQLQKTMFHSTRVRIMLNKKNQSRLAFAPKKKKQSQN